jgi:hypothetical protein
VDGAYLDRAYKDLKHLRAETLADRERHLDLPSRTDLAFALSRQSEVKSQGARGTCSIFASTALMESMLIIDKKYPTTVDLSEEWLEYQIMKSSFGEGSSGASNLRAMLAYGMPTEAELPYIGETWEKLEDSDLAKERCGKIEDATRLARCLRGHRDPVLMSATDDVLNDKEGTLYDPEFSQARKSAESMRRLALKAGSRNSYLSESEVKTLLAAGVPVTVGLDFYYGAWNHRGAEALGIPRDVKAFEAGIVGYPAIGSVDREKSPTDPAGHEILLVGYDDDLVVTTQQLMTDGTTKTLKYKGVYFFKNSWGTARFGITTEIDGIAAAGYGIMTQKYANEFGSFSQLSLK